MGSTVRDERQEKPGRRLRENEKYYYPRNTLPKPPDREGIVMERREVAVQSRMSMGKEVQKRDVKREGQILSVNKSRYRGTEDRDR